MRREKSLLSDLRGLFYSNSTTDELVTEQLLIGDPTTVANSSNMPVFAASSAVLQGLRSNSSDVYLHVVLVKCDGTGKPITSDVSAKTLAAGDALYDVIRMTKHAPVPASFKHRYLLSDFGWAEHSAVEGIY